MTETTWLPMPKILNSLQQCTSDPGVSNAHQQLVFLNFSYSGRYVLLFIWF